MEELRNDSESMTIWQRHRFFVLIAGVILISLGMVIIGMYMYNTSGAAQVDLSRPGYQSVRSEASRDGVADAFPATGTLSDEDFDTFNKMYDNHSRQVVGVESFDPSPLDTDTLHLFVENSPQATR